MISGYDRVVTHGTNERQIRMSVFGERLRLMRQKKGLNQLQFAELLGVSQQQVSGYERAVSPKPDLISKMASLLDTTANYLVGQTNDPIPLSPVERQIVNAHRRGDMDTINNLVAAKFDDLFKNDPAASGGGQDS